MLHCAPCQQPCLHPLSTSAPAIFPIMSNVHWCPFARPPTCCWQFSEAKALPGGKEGVVALAGCMDLGQALLLEVRQWVGSALRVA